MTLIGYSRVSTETQTNDPQIDALRAAGCDRIFEERASGASRARPELTRALAALREGDVLVAWKLDRLARSLAHLLELVDDVQSRGAGLRILSQPIDTTSAGGRLVFQIFGAIGEFERELIRERTKSGLAAARKRGRVGGNPRLRPGHAGHADAIMTLRESRRAAYLAELRQIEPEWLPVVQKGRTAGRTWPEVLRAVNAGLAPASRWTLERLKRAVTTYVHEGLLPRDILTPAERRPAEDSVATIVATIASGRPGITLREIGEELTRLRVAPPRGAKWSPGSVAHQLTMARRAGLVG